MKAKSSHKDFKYLVKSFLLFILCILIFVRAITQKTNNVWIFGEHAGLDFNYDPPVGIKRTPVSTETTSLPLSDDNPYLNYTSSICDSAGKLLFFTDGISVWGSQNAKMPRYEQRWPWSGYSVPLIVPHPENDSLYYIFGVSSGSYANRLQYITINAKINNGYGEIVYPQPSTLSNYFTVLKDNCSVFVAATAHCNRKDFWVVGYSQNAFYAYLVTKNGVSLNNVQTNVDERILQKGIYEGRNIKFSASGEKLVMPILSSNQIIVLNFNNLNGQFSNPIKLTIPENSVLEDVELSPDGSKLYFGAYTTLSQEEGSAQIHSIYQMDLNAGTEENIEKSIVNLTPFGDRVSCVRLCFLLKRTLQLAPDNKIYANMRFVLDRTLKLDETASIIEAPNEKGTIASYKQGALNIGSKYYYMAYNYIRSSSFTPEKNAIQFKQNTCADLPVNFSLIYNNIDSVRWNFGDSLSGQSNFSGLHTPQHAYPNPGTYNITAVIYQTCFTDTSYCEVNISKEKNVHLPQNINDLLACKGEVVHVNATTPSAEHYLWSTGNQQPVQIIKLAGTYQVTATNNCSSDQKTFTVAYQPCDCNVFVPNAFTPNHDGLNDVFKPITSCYVAKYKFQIFNRFGQVQFSSSNPGDAWDGNIDAYAAGTGTYVWKLIYQNPNDKKMYQQAGTVTLLR